MPDLLLTGDFTLHSGQRSRFKIDADALSDQDIETAAAWLAEMLPPFCTVEGIPRGGLRLAEALRKHAAPLPALTKDVEEWIRRTNGKPPRGRHLLVDDVLTTSGSLFRARADYYNREFSGCHLSGDAETHVVGAVLFARGPVPSWVTALFVLGSSLAR